MLSVSWQFSMFGGSDPGCRKTRLREIALAERQMRPNIDHAEDFLSALPYPDRRGEVRRRTDEQRR